MPRLNRLIKKHGSMEPPDLRLILAGDCPKAAVVSISDQCDIFFPQLSAF